MAQGSGRFVFPRAELARQVADGLLGRSLEDFASGLFLSAPRRTGKSHFLREDLIPVLRDRRLEVLYVDLWAQRDKDPAAVVLDAIKGALNATIARPIRRLAREGGLSKLGIAGLTFDVEKIGAPDGASISAALTNLAARTGRQVCFVVDEAQHTQRTEAGKNLMYALKAARDAMNQGDGGLPRGIPGRNLLLVFTGSNRNKLAALVLGREQAFFGATIKEFPLLADDFARALAKWFNGRLAAEQRFGVPEVVEAFGLLWRRPEEVLKAMQVAALNAVPLTREVAEIRLAAWNDNQRRFDLRSRLEQAVIAELATSSGDFAPFSQGTLATYAASLGRAVTKVEVQGALDALRDAEILWRSGRGAYAFEDQDMQDWFLDVRPPLGEEVATGGIAEASPAGMVLDLLAKGMSLAAVARCMLATDKTVRGWRDGRSPQSDAALLRLSALHRVLASTPLRWEQILAVVPNLPKVLERPDADWSEASRLVEGARH